MSKSVKNYTTRELQLKIESLQAALDTTNDELERSPYDDELRHCQQDLRLQIRLQARCLLMVTKELRQRGVPQELV